MVCRNPFAKTWRRSNSFSAAAEIEKSDAHLDAAAKLRVYVFVLSTFSHICAVRRSMFGVTMVNPVFKFPLRSRPGDGSVCVWCINFHFIMINWPD